MTTSVKFGKGFDSQFWLWSVQNFLCKDKCHISGSLFFSTSYLFQIKKLEIIEIKKSIKWSHHSGTGAIRKLIVASLENLL